MSGFEGFVAAAAQIGLQNVLIRPVRKISNPTYSFQGQIFTLSDIVAQAVLEEKHVDRLEITEHPVEYGAAISDHAFKIPAEVVLTLGWSNSPTATGVLNSVFGAGVGAAAAVSQTVRNVITPISISFQVQSMLSGAGVDQIIAAYNALLALQETRSLFNLYTGKRFYQNMICRTLVTETDFEKENALVVTMECQEILLVNTNVVALPSGTQANAAETQSQTNKGTQALQ